ncbi:poly(A) RNA polymerase, mitochondrial-like [Diabrotica virgifera virgifera]|uniref:Poly(A) RNA polymerase, mitochondrial n=1 Tax=Diabrotica virgifera virgifera TaxID=50390 RepID=A0ABM5K1A5_DIAVI|nr:poly(A) RNA polymerase, mitochondrial-like [Diabrotica virgifera virgifera]
MHSFLNFCRFKYSENNLRNACSILCLKKTSKYKTVRHFSVENKIVKDEKPEKFIPFLQRINLRRSEARRSMVVQVQSTQSFKELYSYCNAIGKIKYMFHYSVGIEPLHFIIVEFETDTDITNIKKSSIFVEGSLGLPTQSHFVWFRAAHKKLPKLKQIKSACLTVEHGTAIKEEETIKEMLSKSENISDQIKTLHEITKLNDVGTRLRFLTALQIEDAVNGMFPHAVAYPFGSSVNGYGKMGCDLDLFLKLAADKHNNENGRLVFHCKPLNGSERTMNQRYMETLGDLIYLFLPGCGQVRRILQARVPIVKYHQQLTDVECDVSMTNMSGVHMSDLLYIMGEQDERVRPLIFAIRKWAHIAGITNSSPGRWISNFSLTLLVLAFLQNPLSGKPVLPSLNKLAELSGPEDKFQLEDGTDVSFLRDIRKYKTKTKNTDSLEQLLKEFFEYYAHFDFENKAVCLNETVNVPKPEFSPMYIINPLERGLNVSKNVSSDEVVRFKNEVRNAAWVLESQESKSAHWGLLSILQNKRTNSILQAVSGHSQPGRLVEVSTLFENENEDNKKQTKRNNMKNSQR